MDAPYNRNCEMMLGSNHDVIRISEFKKFVDDVKKYYSKMLS